MDATDREALALIKKYAKVRAAKNAKSINPMVHAMACVVFSFEELEGAFDKHRSCCGEAELHVHEEYQAKYEHVRKQIREFKQAAAKAGYLRAG